MITIILALIAHFTCTELPMYLKVIIEAIIIVIWAYKIGMFKSIIAFAIFEGLLYIFLNPTFSTLFLRIFVNIPFWILWWYAFKYYKWIGWIWFIPFHLIFNDMMDKGYCIYAILLVYWSLVYFLNKEQWIANDVNLKKY